MSSHAVIVFGSINHDVVVRVARLPRPGETVHANDVVELAGGKGANQAVAAARAGAAVRLVGAVGDDPAGAGLLARARDESIDVSQVVVRAGMPTGSAFVFVAPDGENQIVVVSGANGTVDDVLAAEVSLLDGDVVVAQHETPSAPTQRLFERAHDVGARCVLNAAPAAPVDDATLRCTSVLVVNEHELATVVGDVDLVVSGSDEARRAREVLTSRGFAGALVVTLGAQGAIVVDDDATSEIAGHEVDAVDTTGAGDCFVGYLAAELAAGRDFDAALVSANAAAALCVQSFGAAPSMPRRADVDALLATTRR